MTDELQQVRAETKFAPLPLAAEVNISDSSGAVPDTSSRNELKGKIIYVLIILVSCIIILWAFAAIIIADNAEYKPGFFVTVSKQGDCPNCIMITDVLFYETKEDNMNNSTQIFLRCAQWDNHNERPSVVTVNLPGFYKRQICTTTPPPSTNRSVTIVGIISAGFVFIAIFSIIFMKSKK